MVGDGIDKVYKEVENPIVNYIVTKSAKYYLIMFAMAKVMEITKGEKNQIGLYLFNCFPK